jgi:serine phosphatase RsbU (regulator of sigma subunit)
MGDDAVLIIDDDELVRRTFRRVLQQGGLSNIIEAEEGEVGLAKCRAKAPGVVLLDLRMPHMDGLDVLSTLVQQHPDVPVIVVSGQGTMADAVEALRRGAWDFVSKPLPDNEILVRAVRRGLERAALLRQNREYGDSLQRMNQRLTGALEELQTALEALKADERGARQLQFQLLPEDGLRVGQVSCFRRLFPSQLLSGDFLDYFPLGNRYLGLYLADVAGHGAASAFVTAILTTLVAKYRESLLARGDETILKPLQLLSALDKDLEPLRIAKHITLFYGVLELETGKFVYANAGAFPFPLLANGADVKELECSGRPLNLPGRGGFGSGEARLEPNGRLLLVSDGVLEIEPRQSYRDRRDTLVRVMRRARGLEDVLVTLELEEHTALSDDIALLMIRRKESHA